MKNIQSLILLLLTTAILFSCSKWDDFKKYIASGEIIYTGKMDSVKVYSGKERVMLYGLLKADPKIDKVVISWDNGADSVVYNYTKQYAAVDTFIRTFPVSEGVKSFKVVTSDAEGNKSVDVYAVGTSYGENFRRRLANRNILSLDFNDAGTTVNWDVMDAATGPEYTELLYTDGSGTEKRVTAPVSEASTFLEGLTVSTIIRYRTVFKPDATAIDTFMTAYNERAVKVVPPLKNRQVPFIASAKNGRWGNLADWNANDAIRNHGGYGGWDEWNNNIFNVESGWGEPAITNGKLWQTFILGAGTYTFEISDLRDTNLEETDNTYLVVAPGAGLPDVENINTAIGYAKIVNGKPLSALRVIFTVDEPAQVSLGYLTTQRDGTPGKYCNIRAFNFYAN
ncbi:MAG: DUF4998 domain-containing protein [Niabella sp.]